ncbi:hypothetical protein HDU92_003352 [Lobulomyces angularis]|nr:hypothetical protein HDU92_003352 [Lobulomyces angularis]
MSASPKEMDSDTINKIIQQSEFNRDIHKYGNLEAMYNYHNNLFSMPFIPSTRYEFDNLYRSYNEEQYLAWKSWMLESKLAKLVENQKNESLIASAFYETICNSWVKDNVQYLWIVLTKDFHLPCTTLLGGFSSMKNFYQMTNKLGEQFSDSSIRNKMFLCLMSIGEIVKYLDQYKDFVRDPKKAAWRTWKNFSSIYRQVRNQLCHYPFSAIHFLELNDKLELKKEGEKSLDPNLVEIIYDSNFNIIAYDENTGSTLAEGINNCIAKKKLEKMRIFLDQLK